jgi:hypothetical protein
MSRGGFRPPQNFSPSNEKNQPEKMLKPLQDKAPTASTKESAIEGFSGAVGLYPQESPVFKDEVKDTPFCY